MKRELLSLLRPVARCVVWCALAALGVWRIDASAGPGRLDPAERQRLRGEVRQHAFEDRMRARDAHAFDPARPPPGYGYVHPAVPLGPRLTPDERQQLRRQLRDARPGGGEPLQH